MKNAISIPKAAVTIDGVHFVLTQRNDQGEAKNGRPMEGERSIFIVYIMGEKV